MLAIIAGNVQPYQFVLPPTWKQTRVANILSGNYCQPKCAEPWVEVKFEDENQGKVQVVASPLIRLTNKPNASIEDIGSPEKLIASLGPFVTGNTYDSDELLETSVEKLGDQTVQFLLLILFVLWNKYCRNVWILLLSYRIRLLSFNSSNLEYFLYVNDSMGSSSASRGIEYGASPIKDMLEHEQSWSKYSSE